MKTYFSFGRNFSTEAFGLKIDYSLNEIARTGTRQSGTDIMPRNLQVTILRSRFPV